MRVGRRTSMLMAVAIGLLIAAIDPAVAAAAGPDQFQDSFVATYDPAVP